MQYYKILNWKKYQNIYFIRETSLNWPSLFQTPFNFNANQHKTRKLVRRCTSWKLMHVIPGWQKGIPSFTIHLVPVPHLIVAQRLTINIWITNYNTCTIVQVYIQWIYILDTVWIKTSSNRYRRINFIYMQIYIGKFTNPAHNVAIYFVRRILFQQDISFLNIAMILLHDTLTNWIQGYNWCTHALPHLNELHHYHILWAYTVCISNAQNK